MANEPKLYEVLTSAQDMIKALCEHPSTQRILWAVQPENIAVLSVTNKERPQSSNVLAKITRVTAPMEAILLANKIGVKYVIELYGSDWQAMTNARRQAVIFNELLHVPPPVDSGIVKNDVEGFAVLIEALGVNWAKADSLPEILSGEVEFNVKLAPNGASDK
jgi:predicted metallopeptidase